MVDVRNGMLVSEEAEIDEKKALKIFKDLTEMQVRWIKEIGGKLKKYDKNPIEFSQAMQIMWVSLFKMITPKPVELCIHIAHGIVRTEGAIVDSNEDYINQVKQIGEEDKPSYVR